MGSLLMRSINGSAIKLEKVISGGQAGAELGGWLAARASGVPTGGWMSRGFLTADGPDPALAAQFGAAELPTDDELLRIESNVQDSDGTLWFGETTTSAAQATVGACHRLGKTCMPVYPGASFEPSHVSAWIVDNKIRTLNVSGNREVEEPGIGHRVERFLGQVLQLLGHQGA
jgi:hypothetical protein